MLRPPGGGALVFTVDFITPIVDDPATFGAIAAANALSDVYAMGGTPTAALAVCGFPSDVLPLTALEAIFRGGRDKAAEAGCAVVGGHTIRDPELTYGLCVLGSVDPARMLAQPRARPGDVLVLTKPLGVGVAAQALKREALPPDELATLAALLTTLNRDACEAALAAGAHAATDVTGFGLLRHLHNLLSAAGCGARLDSAAVPVLAFVPELARRGFVPGGSQANRVAAEAFCTFDPAVDDTTRLLLADAQTSGGLLIAVPAARAGTLVRELTARGAPAHAIIGELVAGPPHIDVR